MKTWEFINANFVSAEAAAASQSATHQSADLVAALKDLTDLIGSGSSYLDRMMNVSLERLKASMAEINDLAKRYKPLFDKMALIKDTASSAKDPVIVQARASIEAAKVLLACQS